MRNWMLVVIGIALLGLSALSACDSDGSPGDGDGNNEANEPCGISADCIAELSCLGPDDPQACGIPPRTGCGTDDDCSAPETCHAIEDPCSPDGQGSECKAACSVGGCGPGFRCNVGEACEAIPCEGSDECGLTQVCDPNFDGNTAVHARTNGCHPIACTDDGACPDPSVCVNGQCQSDYGFCTVPILAP